MLFKTKAERLKTKAERLKQKNKAKTWRKKVWRFALPPFWGGLGWGFKKINKQYEI